MTVFTKSSLFVAVCLTGAMLTASSTKTMAQVANDECSDAIELMPSMTCNPTAGNVGTATTSDDAPYSDCDVFNMGDMWYVVTATSDANLIVHISDLASTNPELSMGSIAVTAYTGDCDNLEGVGCNGSDYNDGVTTSGDLLIEDVVSGNVYYLKVTKAIAWNEDFEDVDASDFSFNICVRELGDLANDECSDAIAIGDNYSGNNFGATQSMEPGVCDEGFTSTANDVWYQFTAASTGTAEVTLNASGFMFGEIFSGDCENLENIGCAVFEPASIEVTEGSIYYMRVYGYEGDQGSFDINISYTLPLKLVAFDGKTVNNTNVLTWKTVDEKNFSHFELERSTDGRNYTMLGEVKGANSEAGSSYSFADAKPLNGNNMYRIKLVDIDGKFDYSKVVNLENRNNNNFALSIYPNPSENNINVSIAGTISDNAKVVISDISGKRVIETDINGDVTSVDVSSLSSGIYFLKYTDDLNTQITKFSKK